jgi:hypothetical protein
LYILLIRMQQMPKVPFSENNDVVEAFPSDRADEPLRVAILPGWSCRNRSIPNADCFNESNENCTVRTVSITNEISRHFAPTAGFGQLPGNPFRVRT